MPPFPLPRIPSALVPAVLPALLAAQTGVNTNIIPLGDKESLMGNTGTGGLGSTGAVYYNPAAMTQLEGTSFSLSGSAYMRYEFAGEPAAVLEGNELNYTGTGYQTVPTSVIMMRRAGEWHLGFSVLVPSQFAFEGVNTWDLTIAGRGLAIRLEQSYEESLFLAGLSAARKLDERWSVGISLYGQNYSYLATVDSRVQFSDSPELLSQSSQRVKFSPTGLLPILGLHRKGERVDLGLRVSLPSLRLWGTGSYYDMTYGNLAGAGTGTTEVVDVTDTDADHRTPLDVRIGATFHASERWLLATDLSYGLGLDYDVLADPRADFSRKLEDTYRLSLGAEFAWRPDRALLGGFSYTPSTYSESGITNSLDYLAFTLGGKITGEHTETSAGLFHAFGKGDLPLDNGEAGTQLFSYLGLFLGTNVKF